MCPFETSSTEYRREADEDGMPYIEDTVKAYATTGQISNTLRDVFGEH